MLLLFQICEISFSVPGPESFIWLLLSLIFLLLSGLISASEVAFFSLTPQDIDAMEASEQKSDKKILQLLKSPQKLLATILVGNNFVNIALILMLTFVVDSVLSFGNSPVVEFLIKTVFITFIILLLGEIMPKTYASVSGKKVAVFTAPLLIAIAKVFAPVVYLLHNSTSSVFNKLSKNNKQNISIDELSHALELTSDENDEDTGILEGIIKFGNIQVIDIMTPRVEMVDADIKLTFRKMLDLIIESGYSRIPVYSGNRDNIKGVLYGKDLLPHLDKPDNFRWQSLIRQAFYVPETKKIDDLLNEFQKNRVHLAIVVDEYGGTSGLVTLEDIIEEIVGDISDEYDDEESLYTRIDSHTFLFEAKIQLNDFFKIEEIDEDDFYKIREEVETLAGLILELKGEMPVKNESIAYKKYIFKVLSVDNRRIKKLKLYIKDDGKDNDD